MHALNTSESTDCCAPYGTERGSEPPSSLRKPAQGLARAVPCTRPLPYFAVLYTSGSTGQPYGVRMTEGAWLHRIRWMQLHGTRPRVGTPGAGGQDQAHDHGQPCRLYGVGSSPWPKSGCELDAAELGAKAGAVEEAGVEAGVGAEAEAEAGDGGSWASPGTRAAAGAAATAGSAAGHGCSVVCFSTAVSFVDHLWQLLAPALAPAMSEAAAAAQQAAVGQAAAAAVGGGSQGSVAAGVGLGDGGIGPAAAAAAWNVQLPSGCGDAQLDAAEVAAAAAAGPCGVLVPPPGAVLRPEAFVRALAEHGATHLVGYCCLHASWCFLRCQLTSLRATAHF